MRQHERAALERLTRFGGAPLVTELVTLFLEDLPGRIARARAAALAGDASALGAAAHAIRSSSAQLGAANLAAACDAVEKAAEKCDMESAASSVADVEAEARSLTDWLATYVGLDPVVADRLGDTSVATDVERARIAVVEDNADNRLLIDAILGESYVLDEYATGVDALEGMAACRPDLVLLDVSLPGMDGLDVLARMRADPDLRRVPVVAVTAHAMVGDRERYLTAGFDGYVPKPIVDERRLMDLVEGLLRGGTERARVAAPSGHSDTDARP